MGEIINIFIGQCGVQVGESFWDLICQEHQIDKSGVKLQSDQQNCYKNEDLKPFFSESNKEKLTSRSVFIDLDPTTIDALRSSSYRNLFSPDSLISGKEDAASNFARGSFTVGNKFIDVTMDQIRKQAEKCDYLSGFMVFTSTNGGTSGGFNKILSQKISNDYSKVAKICNAIMPSNQMSSSVVEPYNFVLSMQSLITNYDFCVFYQNQALYNIYSNQLDVESPHYSDINRLISQVMSSTTTSIRFRGDLNMKLNEMTTNLVPYPRIHFIIPSYTPFTNGENSSFNQRKLTSNIFKNESSLVDCNINAHPYMACCYQLRGDVIPKDVLESIQVERNKKTIKFVDWVHTGFKLGVNTFTPVPLVKGSDHIPKTDATLLSNNNCVGDTFSRFDHKFDLLYSRMAFLYWYIGEGMEQEEFSEAREDIAALEKDYEYSSPDYDYDYEDDQVE